MTAPDLIALAVTLRYKLRGLSRTQLADARARLARGLVDVAGRERQVWLADPTVQVSHDDHALIVKARLVDPPHPDDPLRDAHDAVMTAAGAGLANLPIGRPARTRVHEALPFRTA